MARCVVQHLELIEINKQHGTESPIAVASSDCMFQVILQESAVGQMGQRIKEGQLHNLVFCQLAVSNVNV